MDVRRRNVKNKIINEQKELINNIKRHESTIINMKSSGMGKDYVKSHSDKLVTIIDNYSKKINDLETRLKQLKDGELDDEINDEYNNTTIHLHKLKDIKSQNKLKKKIKKQHDMDTYNKYMKVVIKESRNDRRQYRDYDYCFRYYKKVCATIPDYMIQKLSVMPNNKGYIWRGVSLYGYQRSQNGPRVLFERRKGILYIHEYIDTYTGKIYNLYTKNGRDLKVLVSSVNKPKQFQ